jgi:hydrogenase maturation protease
MNTIVIGLGNPILSDDAAGPCVAAELKDLSGRNGISVEEANMGGLGLLDLLAGHEEAIIIDAIQTADAKAGHIDRLDLKTLRSSRRNGTAHDFDLSAALKLGEQLGIHLPRKIDVFTIEANDVSTFNEKCTPEVEKAITICAGMIRRELAKRGLVS